MRSMSEWKPITDLPQNGEPLADPGLKELAALWVEQRQRLETTNSYQTFLEKIRRKNCYRNRRD